LTLTFEYEVVDASGDKRRVCERAYLAMLGYKSTSYQWKKCKDLVVRQHLAVDEIAAGTYNMKYVRASPKREHAIAWLRRFATQLGDSIIERGVLKGVEKGTEVDATLPIKVAPFPTVPKFFEHYKVLTKGQPNQACLDSFRRSFKSFQRKSMVEHNFLVRLSPCKGNFSRCDICDNCHALLNDKSRRWLPHEAKMLQDYKLAHNRLQKGERIKQEEDIAAAKELDANGDPKRIFMLFDGYSIFKGATVKWGDGSYGGRSKSQKEEAKILNRVIGGIVVCGDINTVFLYTVDQMVHGEANLMVVVIRRALGDLGKKLMESGKIMAPILMLQFDNCGEKKNKFMFAYASLLVESQVFKQVFIHFLITGHTHCVIDQYFSVLSYKIIGAKFIGSPLALHNLLKTAHNEESQRPLIVDFIKVCPSKMKCFVSHLKNWPAIRLFMISRRR